MEVYPFGDEVPLVMFNTNDIIGGCHGVMKQVKESSNGMLREHHGNVATVALPNPV